MSLALISTSGVFTTNIVEGDKAETIAPIVSGVALTATGTSIDFTGIPNWVKRVTVMFNGVSTNGTTSILIQIGSGVIQTTGYVSGSVAGANNAGAAQTAGVNSTAGYIHYHTNAASSNSGAFVLTRLNATVWVGQGVMNSNAGTLNTFMSAGTVTLTGALDRVRITTVNGTDVFDAGTINIMWE